MGIRHINERDAWVTNADGDIIGIQLHGRSEMVDLRNPVNADVNELTGGVEIPFVVKGKSSAALAAAPSAADIALGDSTMFYDIADPTKRYAMNAARSAFVLVADGKTSPYILSQSASPVILLPSGAVNSSGQFTLTTPLPYVPTGTVKVYVFAGVGIAAGLYSATFSSTTVCQLVGNPVTTAGAYAGGTTEVAMATIQIPGMAIGISGAIRISCASATLNSATSKTTRCRLGGASGGLLSSSTTAAGHSFSGLIKNKAAHNSQVWMTQSTASYTPNYTGVDSSSDLSLTFNCQLGVSTDYIILECYTVEILPGA